jgi:D-alanine--poly(phosphoribitol) ligase subunit 2
MHDQRTKILAELRVVLREVAGKLGHDIADVADDDIIPDTGVLDSAGLLEFVVLIDEKYALALEPEEMTIDNLGSLAAIVDFVLARRQA